MSLHQLRQQRTLKRAVTVSGFGLFGGLDVTVEFCPAPTDHGIVFERIDLSPTVEIPATVEHVVPKPRCTILTKDGATVEVVEHLMAALAGLKIDNCLVKMNAPEPPVGDGSSQHFVEALKSAGICEQDAKRDCLRVEQLEVATECDFVGVAVQSPRDNEYEIGFVLEYDSPQIPLQCHKVAVQPESFCEELAPCRTFVLEEEVNAIQSQGIGLRATPQNILVFGEDGPIENELRFPNECVKHKILDCVGDFALLGCDIQGRFTATRSGHRLNHAIIRTLRSTYLSLKNSADKTLPFPPAAGDRTLRSAG